MTPAPLLRLQGLGKAYRDTPVFEAVSLEMAPGEVVALVGDSGVGKSTLLNCIAGLDRADRGQVEIAGREVQALHKSGRAIPVHLAVSEVTIPGQEEVEFIGILSDLSELYRAREREQAQAERASTAAQRVQQQRARQQAQQQLLEGAEDVVDRHADPLEQRAEVQHDPVDGVGHPAVERDQRFMERIQDVEMFRLRRRRAV